MNAMNIIAIESTATSMTLIGGKWFTCSEQRLPFLPPANSVDSCTLPKSFWQITIVLRGRTFSQANIQLNLTNMISRVAGTK